MAVDTHLFHNWRPRVRVYTLSDPTHNPPNKFNYCDHIFVTEGLLAKFAKIKTAQKFVVIRYYTSPDTKVTMCVGRSFFPI